MEAVAFSLITVLAWGTWLAPAQSVAGLDERLRTVLVTLGNLLLAIVVALSVGLDQLDRPTAVYTFLGGVVWALAGACAFTATARLGIARAMGIWAPLNILVAMVWGLVLFAELTQQPPAVMGGVVIAVVLMVMGIILIVTARSEHTAGTSMRRQFMLGLAGALAAGVLWGSYFIPIRLADVSLWVANLPMACGMLAGSLLLALTAGTRRPPPAGDALRLMIAGLLWGVGNFGALKLMALIGTGPGFAIAQLCVVVNALVGIAWFHNPAPRSAAARWTLLGVGLATAGGITLGLLRS